MSTLTEIENAIAKLPQEDFRMLLRHLQERDAEGWDRQIEQDAQNGKLDALYARLTESDAGSLKVPLHEVLDDPQFS